MVGGDEIDHAGVQPVPQRGIVGRGADRRVHLDERAEPRIVSGVEQQVIGNDFGRHPRRLVPAQHLDFFPGREMQDVQAAPIFLR
jgi:hypothetical protein